MSASFNPLFVEAAILRPGAGAGAQIAAPAVSILSSLRQQF